MRVVVVGAGIVGAAIARALAVGGADVVVLDCAAPAASPASFGWINASFYADTAHHRLRAEGIAAYHRLIERGGDWPVVFGGALWWEAQGAELVKVAATLKDLRYPAVRLSEADVRAREPDLAAPPAEALLFETEGWAEVSAFTARLLAQARSAGARLVQGPRATAILTRGGVVTGLRTDGADIAADRIVVAAGTGAPALLGSVDVRLPMLSRPGAIVTSAPAKARLSSVLVTPDGEVRQLPDGRLLSPAAANHQGDTAEVITESVEQIGAQTSARLGRLIGQPDLGWESVQIANRPVPQDGLPVLGAAGPEGLHVAVMHSGVTLAAMAAEVTAAQVLGGLSEHQAALIAPYDAMRFT